MVILLKKWNTDQTWFLQLDILKLTIDLHSDVCGTILLLHPCIFRMYSYQSRVPPPPPPLSRAVIPSKRPRVSLSGGGSRRTKTSFSSSKSSQRSSRTSRYHSCVADVSRQTKLVITFFFSAARPPHSEGGRPADHQERAHADQTQGGLPAGEPGAHGEGPQQEVG